MDIQFGDIQETALVTLAIRASETARPEPRIRDEKAAEIIRGLEPRMQLVSEQSYNVGMRKHTLRGKLFAATVGKNVNNRIAGFCW